MTIMKNLKCDLCNFVASGDSFEEWMENLKPHYMEAHMDFMKDPNHTEADRQKWMTDNKARFEAA